MTEKEVLEWILAVVIPRIIKNDEFRGLTIQKTEVQATEGNKDNWASSIYEISLQFLSGSNKKSFSLLLKLMHEDEKVRIQMQSDKQFFNEIHLYSVVVPLFSSQVLPSKIKTEFENLFPKCYYSCYDKSKIPLTTKDVILVMEDLKVSNYRLGNRTSLDLKHCSLALTRLGLFHAFSYFMKERDPETLKRVIAQPIYETNYAVDGKETTSIVFGVSEQRVIAGLAKEVPEDDTGLTRLRTIADRDAFGLFTDLVQPREPLSVLCHGDFLRNNVMFRYENDEPVDMKLIDFQTVRYASPAIDVSLLICMNTTHEVRKAHFDQMLQVYHTSLSDSLASLLGKRKDQLDPRYSFESFYADFRQHALYGYLIAIEFLPWMLSSEEELALISQLNTEERGSPRYNEVARAIGGEDVTRVLVELAKDLLAKQCL